MFRFAGFELDQQRAELRGPDGGAIKLRPKTFEMLRLFAGGEFVYPVEEPAPVVTQSRLGRLVRGLRWRPHGPSSTNGASS